MKIYRLLPLLVLPFLLIMSSCDTASDDDAVITGQVSDIDTGNPIAGATVEIDSPSELIDFVKTDAQGNYEIGGISISEVTDITLVASAATYKEASQSFKVAPSDALDNIDFELASVDSDSDSGSGDGDVVSGAPEGAAAIILREISSESINVSQTGGEVSSRFTFEVQDSAGRAINTDGAVEVQFSILKGPGGGETVIPDVVSTNADGQVVTSLFSGDSAGVVRVRALIDRSDIGLTIISDPILVAINGGFPSPDRFFVGTPNTNIEGYGLISAGTDLEYNVIASVGDQWGNPVKEGTAVDFRTIGAGVIQGSALTDEFGRATVKLRPDGSSPTTDPLGVGFFTVKGKTVDQNNDFINKELNLLFTTSEAIISINPTNVNIPTNGSQAFTYTVTDLNGNPMSAGSDIGIVVTDGLSATGDVGFILGDFTTTGAGRTDFGFTVTDVDEDNAAGAGASITVRVESASTGSSTSVTITGVRGKTTGGLVFDSRNIERTFKEGTKHLNKLQRN